MSHAGLHVGSHEVPYLGHPPPSPPRAVFPGLQNGLLMLNRGGTFLFSLEGECPVGHWVDVYLSAEVHFEGGELVCNLLVSRGR